MAAFAVAAHDLIVGSDRVDRGTGRIRWRSAALETGTDNPLSSGGPCDQDGCGRDGPRYLGLRLMQGAKAARMSDKAPAGGATESSSTTPAGVTAAQRQLSMAQSRVCPLSVAAAIAVRSQSSYFGLISTNRFGLNQQKQLVINQRDAANGLQIVSPASSANLDFIYPVRNNRLAPPARPRTHTHTHTRTHWGRVTRYTPPSRASSPRTHFVFLLFLFFRACVCLCMRVFVQMPVFSERSYVQKMFSTEIGYIVIAVLVLCSLFTLSLMGYLFINRHNQVRRRTHADADARRGPLLCCSDGNKGRC